MVVDITIGSTVWLRLRGTGMLAGRKARPDALLPSTVGNCSRLELLPHWSEKGFFSQTSAIATTPNMLVC